MTASLATTSTGPVIDGADDPLDGYESPEERASARRTDLRNSFSEALFTIAKMYRDEDWRFLTRDDGSPYASLGEVVAEDLHVSVSMARRYVQGARHFTLPLMEFIVDGTHIPVTSGDIATLGTDGITNAVSLATRGLEGVTDPDEQTQVIRDSIDEAHAAKSGPPPQPYSDTAAENRDWDDPGPAERSAPSGRGEVDPYFDASDLEELPPASGPLAPTGGRLHFVDEDGDPVAAIVASGTLYDTDDALTQISDPALREVARALNLLATMDPETLAKSVAYETRGVLLPVDAALDNVARFRSVAETQNWLVHLLASGA